MVYKNKTNKGSSGYGERSDIVQDYIEHLQS